MSTTECCLRQRLKKQNYLLKTNSQFLLFPRLFINILADRKQLKVRISQHKGISFRTGNVLNSVG